MKINILTIVIIALFGAFTTIGILTSKLKAVKIDRDRIETNFFNSNFELSKTKNEKGELEVSVNKLTLKNTEAEIFTKDLVKEVENLNLKLKNVKGITKIEYVYRYKIDSTKIFKLNDTTFKATFKDEWLTIQQQISLTENKSNIKIDTMELALKDGLVLVDEVLYKRRFIFWKKTMGVKLHITSKNPHIDIDRVQTVELQK